MDPKSFYNAAAVGLTNLQSNGKAQQFTNQQFNDFFTIAYDQQRQQQQQQQQQQAFIKSSSPTKKPTQGGIEIVTPVWSEAENASGILHVKEKRPFGATRGNTSVPQVPELVVRIPATLGGDDPKKTKYMGIRAELWDYGPANGKNNRDTANLPKGVKFERLKNGLEISCTNNICVFSAPKEDGYRYATLKCAISRAARIPCKRQHIALKLECVRTKNVDGCVQATAVVAGVQPVRTRRISVSEKAMCPRACDIRKKERTQFLSKQKSDQQIFLPRGHNGVDQLANITRTLHSGSFSSCGTFSSAGSTQKDGDVTEGSFNSGSASNSPEPMASQQQQQHAAYLSYIQNNPFVASQPVDNGYPSFLNRRISGNSASNESIQGETDFVQNTASLSLPGPPIINMPPFARESSGESQPATQAAAFQFSQTQKKRSFDDMYNLSPCLTPLVTSQSSMQSNTQKSKMMKMMPQLSLAPSSASSTAPSSPTIQPRTLNAEWLQSASQVMQQQHSQPPSHLPSVQQKNDKGMNVMRNYNPILLLNSMLGQSFST